MHTHGSGCRSHRVSAVGFVTDVPSVTECYAAGSWRDVLVELKRHIATVSIGVAGGRIGTTVPCGSSRTVFIRCSMMSSGCCVMIRWPTLEQLPSAGWLRKTPVGSCSTPSTVRTRKPVHVTATDGASHGQNHSVQTHRSRSRSPSAHRSRITVCVPVVWLNTLARQPRSGEGEIVSRYGVWAVHRKFRVLGSSLKPGRRGSDPGRFFFQLLCSLG